jgi:lambda family phage portal protein
MSNFATRIRIKGTGLYVEQQQPRKMRASGAPAYEGASTAARLQGWRVSSAGPNSALSSSLDTLRSRSRDMVRKNGLADGAAEKLVDALIGTGIKPQWMTSDAAFNKTIAKLWSRWTDEADAAGEFDFYGLQSIATRSMVEGGEVFTRLRPRRRGDVRTVPLQLQTLESEFCPVDKNQLITSSRYIQCGVEFDAIGRRVAYHLYREHPSDVGVRLWGMADTVAVPANEVVHMKAVRRPGSVRGEPWLTRALVKLYDLDKYDDAQLVKQQLATMFAGFMSPSTDGLAAFVEDADENGVALSPLEPGTMQVLPPGSNMTFSNPPSVGDYDQFNRQQHHYIAASIGLLYEQLTGDYSQVNDRQWRAAFNEFKRKIERHQHNLIVFQYCRPIVRRWVELGILSGALSIPAGVDIEDVMMPRWIPQAFAYINPVQDVQAQTEEVRAGFSSRKMKVSERGFDVEEIDAEIAADNERTEGLNVVLTTNPGLVSNAGVTQARPGGSGFVEPGTEPELPAPAKPNF